jgi:hypothetical protein
MEVETVTSTNGEADYSEPLSETLLWLWDNGLIEWNGEFRNGRKVFVMTERGRTYYGPFEEDWLALGGEDDE